MPSADVLTYHNDNMRTGANPNETTLTPANVNASTFGKVGQVAVDGHVNAQPLYKSNQLIPGQGIHDVVYVATEHDSVYALDAHTLQVLWHDSFIDPARGITTIPAGDILTDQLGPELGIMGTPVINPATNAIYLVTRTKTVTGSSVVYGAQLHALDLGTGQEKSGGPVTITASVRGKGDGSINGRIDFDPLWELQRSGLLLLNGTVYVSFAGENTHDPYHGWMMGYNAKTLRHVSTLVDTPDAGRGGFWMSGGAPAADQQGNIYVSTGNGTFDANTGGRDYGDSILKIKARNLKVVDYFTPSNQQWMDTYDRDLGSGGVLLLPPQPGTRRHALLASGKEGKVYVINRDRLGHFSPAGDRVFQALPGVTNQTYDTPAYFNQTVYYVGTGKQMPGRAPNALLALHLNQGLVTSMTAGNFTYGYPGSTPSISSNGLSNGIVWTLDNSGNPTDPAILRAYDAGDVTNEIYDSTQAGDRDAGGAAVNFAVPTVANGRVYVGGSGFLTVYGLLAGD